VLNRKLVTIGEMMSYTTMFSKLPDQTRRILMSRKMMMLRNWKVVKTKARIRIRKMRS